MPSRRGGPTGQHWPSSIGRSARARPAPGAPRVRGGARSRPRGSGPARPTRSGPGSRRRSTARPSPAASAAVHEALTAESGGARDGVAVALREARLVARVDPRYEALAERLAGLEAELTDVAAESRSLAETVEHDPAALAALEERLGTIYALERRYGDGEAAVIAHGERAAAEAERLHGLDGERARRDADDARLLAEVQAAAAAPVRGPPHGRGRDDVRGRRRARRARFPRGRVRGRARTADRPARTSPRSSSRATRSRSTRRAPTRSSTDWPPTPASRRGRWPGSRPAGSSPASPWPSSRSSPRPTRPRRSCSTRSTRASADAARTRSGGACGRSLAVTRSCA